MFLNIYIYFFFYKKIYINANNHIVNKKIKEKNIKYNLLFLLYIIYNNIHIL